MVADDESVSGVNDHFLARENESGCGRERESESESETRGVDESGVELGQ